MYFENGIKGEIPNLQWNQIDFRTRTIRIEKTKSGKVRYIPITSSLYKELLKLKSRNGLNSYVFFNPETRKPYKDIKKAFRGACRRANIKDLTFHSLRHTVGSRAIQKGNIATVQNLLGHQSITTTQRYIHSDLNQMREALESMNVNPEETTRKKGELLHNCYTDKERQTKEPLQKLPNHLFSMN